MDTKMLVGWLVAVGAVNWGLTALGFNVVETILGMGMITKAVYLIIGVAGVVKLYHLVSPKKKR